MKKILLFGLLAIPLLAIGYVALSADTTLTSGIKSALHFQNEGNPFVYETNADSENECASFETYDAENQVCSFECTSKQDCKDAQTLADQEFQNWSTELENDDSPVDEKNIASTDTSQKASYEVTQGEKIKLVFGTDTAEYGAIWEAISALSPNDVSNSYIDAFQVFDNKKDDTLAFVDDEDGNGKWRIGVNLSGYKSSTLREQRATLIHELGHIISLNTSQVDSTVSKDACGTFAIDEGCLRSYAYLNAFKQSFWKNTLTQTFNKNSFVTEYAATSEIEDFAETFAFFVLGPGIDSLGSATKDEKIKLLYQYPALIAIRNDMRQTLAASIVRTHKRMSASDI